jgi:hypothetical protein
VAGNTFTIVSNDSTDAITGTFNGLPESAVFSVPRVAMSPLTFQITYKGGDGNDVVLTALNPTNPTFLGTSGDDNWLVKRNAVNLEVTLNNSLIWTTPFDALA